MVGHPAQWPWSSYVGYANRRQRVPWICYDTVLRAWRGECGGSDAPRAYRTFVERGIEDPPASPLEDARQGWILGSREFADRLRNLLHSRDAQPEVPRDSQLRGLDVSSIWLAVADHSGVAQEALGQRSRHTEMRAVCAWLAKRHRPATLRELAPLPGWGRAPSVGHLTRRVDEALGKSKELRRTMETIESRLAGAHAARPPQKKKK